MFFLCKLANELGRGRTKKIKPTFTAPQQQLLELRVFGVF